MTDLDARSIECDMDNNCGILHKGFKDAFEIMKPSLDGYLGQLQARMPIKTLIITGHSLGGAFATLASMHVAVKYPGMLKYAFLMGSPRVGDESFAKKFHDRIVDGEGAEVKRFFMSEGGLSGRYDPITLTPGGKFRHGNKGIAVECQEQDGSDCTARRLHAIFLFVDVMKQFVNEKWLAQKKCGLVY